MFRAASDDDIEAYSDSVTCLIRKCIEDVVPDDRKQASYDLRRSIKAAKRQYKNKVEEHFNNNNARSMWQSINNITGFKGNKPATVNIAASLPDELNTFYARFEADNTAQTASAPVAAAEEVSPLSLSVADVTRSFKRVNIRKAVGPDGIPGRVLKKTYQHLFFLRRLRKFGTSPSILRSFYTCTVESILTGCITAWFGNTTAGNRKALQRVVRTARHIVGGELPSFQDIYTRRCKRKARRIVKDSSHPSHRLLSLLPSGRRLRSIRSRTSRLRDSFFPQAIRLINSQK